MLVESCVVFLVKPWLEIPVTITILPVSTKSGCSEWACPPPPTHTNTSHFKHKIVQFGCSKLEMKKYWVQDREREKV